MVALEGTQLRRGCELRCEEGAGVLEVIKGLAMECVRAGLRSNEHLAGGGHIAGDILRGAVELELANRALRHVEDRGSDGFVCNVLSIQKDAGGTTGHAIHRQGRIASLGRIKRTASL